MMKHCLFFSLCLAMILPACAPKPTVVPTATATPTTLATPTATAVPTPVSPFNYDASVPFDVKVNSETGQDGAIVTDLSYAAHDKQWAPNLGGRTVAYLVRPAQKQGSFAGVVFLHWLGSGRREFLDEAVALAKRGVVSLLINGQVPYMEAFHWDARDVALVAGQVIEMRRAIDFLVAQPGVDPQRIGVVGHAYGAMYTALLSGVDARPKTFVIVAGYLAWEDLAAAFGANADDYRLVMAPIEPVDFVGKAGSASILFQFGEYLSPEDTSRFSDAVAGPKKILWYPTGENMNSEQVLPDRTDWLAGKLGLPAQ
jgi:dienelactone hydrolase